MGIRQNACAAAIVLLVLLATGGQASVPVDVPGAYVRASEDVMVDHGEPDRNFEGIDPGGGPESRMMLTDSFAQYGSEDSRYALMKFPVSPALGRDLFCLRVYVETVDGGPAPEGGRYAVYAVPNAWSETGVTWNTAPPAGATPDATLEYAGAGRWYSFDVTTAVSAAVAQGESAVSFKLRIEHPDALKYSWVHSRGMAHAERLVRLGAGCDALAPLLDP